MIGKCITMALVSVSLIACTGGKKKGLAFYGNDTETAIDSPLPNSGANTGGYGAMPDASSISVPFSERNGVKYVNVSVNGLGFEMIFDTGCSITLISVAEANYLYQKGYLTKDDILGVTKSQIADGSIVENMVVNLKDVIIDGKIRCVDVTATVSANTKAPLLLGNEILNRVAAYTIDNENQTINFKLK